MGNCQPVIALPSALRAAGSLAWSARPSALLMHPLPHLPAVQPASATPARPQRAADLTRNVCRPTHMGGPPHDAGAWGLDTALQTRVGMQRPLNRGLAHPASCGTDTPAALLTAAARLKCSPPVAPRPGGLPGSRTSPHRVSGLLRPSQPGCPVRTPRHRRGRPRGSSPPSRRPYAHRAAYRTPHSAATIRTASSNFM